MTDDRIAEIRERQENSLAYEGGRLLYKDFRFVLAEVSRLREQLDRWECGERRKSWPVIEAVPDGLHYAAELVRAQGTEGGDDHDALLRAASLRLKRLHDVAGPLLAKRDDLFAENAGLREQVSQLETVYKISTANVVEQLCRAQVAEATIARVEALVGQWDSLARTLDGAPKTTIHSVVQRLRGALASAGVVGGEATPTETPQPVHRMANHLCNPKCPDYAPAAVPVPTEEPSDA